jgi:hypothetical protein
VEVYQAGTWWAGELLGWRHDAAGSCQVWVRVVLGGIEETAWTDLATLRLPERHLSVAQPASAVHGPATQEMSVARHPSGRRRAVEADAQVTAGLAPVRDLSVVPDLPATGGRRTADETAQFASVGRRRAPELVESPQSGRRRAPETGEMPAVGRRRAPDSTPAVSQAGAAGRHRAPGDRGRSGPADTALAPVVSETPRPPRPQKRATEAWTAPEGADSDLLTRPMRLTDQAAQSRRPRLGGSLSV